MLHKDELELSTTGTHGKLILAIYGYFAETEREIISMRTKRGLASAKEKGKLLGRPKGSKNKKSRALYHFNDTIMAYLEIGLDLSFIRKLVNQHLPEPLIYQSFKYHIEHHPKLSEIRKMKNLKAQTLKNNFISCGTFGTFVGFYPLMKREINKLVLDEKK